MEPPQETDVLKLGTRETIKRPSYNTLLSKVSSLKYPHIHYLSFSGCENRSMLANSNSTHIDYLCVSVCLHMCYAHECMGVHDLYMYMQRSEWDI